MRKTYKRKPVSAALLPVFSALEQRLMFCLDGHDDVPGAHGAHGAHHADPSMGTFPAIKAAANSGSSNNSNGSSAPAAGSPLSAIPIIHTNPGAAAKLY